jgi:crossover junction endodeoxyribonuclease RuvC
VRLIGLDPGLRHTGWGVIEVAGQRLSPVADGAVHSDERAPLAVRLRQLFDGLGEVLARYRPDEAAVEETFVNRNPASALKLGMARGVVVLAPATAGLPVFEYPANVIKKSVVGAGHAGKSQVQMMISRLLPGSRGLTPDAADALAVAVCHAHHRATRLAWGVGSVSGLRGALSASAEMDASQIGASQNGRRVDRIGRRVGPHPAGRVSREVLP